MVTKLFIIFVTRDLRIILIKLTKGCTNMFKGPRMVFKSHFALYINKHGLQSKDFSIQNHNRHLQQIYNKHALIAFKMTHKTSYGCEVIKNNDQ